jgi:hypothetical protein
LGNRIANSSPPVRATTSCSRTVCESARASDLITASPNSCPRRSFAAFRPSTSTTITDAGRSLSRIDA